MSIAGNYNLPFSYGHISANGTNVIKSGPGVLHAIVYNTAGATATATVYDNTAGSGTVIAVLGTTAGTFAYDVGFKTGLTIVTAGTTAGDMTVIYA